MLKIKKGFIIRKVGKGYMVVAVGAASENFNGMIKLDETGAFYWKEMENGISREDLVAKMLERFEDLDEATARADLDEFVKTIKFACEEQ